ncbi:(Monoglyceride) lipase, putative [Candida maltosa Xu316]|uniref:(Monoglyceride) lipase, putative n=1 Tax=Candida maltosa (strain Xu316) TaxID=1245528 RepID=M3K2Y8_CANMX|nr:(Monoglyceride) lipase, putative [Candida maltosa Xu316]
MTSNIDVPIPYTPIGAPTVEFVEYNKANFKTVTWKVPESVPYKGKIIYVHGFAEDSTIYTEFFDNLSQAGYEVFFFDQRGAGETSPGKLVGQTNEFYVFDDLDFFVKRNLDARTDKSEKFYMLGHSMGGGIVLNYGIRGKYVDDIRGILACGPLVQLHDDSKPNIVLRGLQPVINHLLPSFTIDSKLKYDYITSSERYRNYFVKKDMKLIGSVRQFNDMFVRGEKLLDPKYAALFKNELPLLIIHFG